MLEGLTNEDLIAECERRGYAVIRRDKVRTATVQREVDVGTLLHYGKEGGFMSHIYQSLGARLGQFLMEHGAVPIQELVGGSTAYSRTFAASVTVFVGDPRFDWPYPLRMD